MYTLNLAGLVKDLEKVRDTDANEPFPFLREEDKKAGDFPTFYRIMTACRPEEIEDITLEQVIALLVKLEKYSAYLEPRKNPLWYAEKALLDTHGCCARRRIL